MEQKYQDNQISAFEERKKELARLREFKTSVPLEEITEHAKDYKA